MPIIIVSEFIVSDAQAGGVCGGGWGEVFESGDPKTYSLEYQSGGFINNPVGLEECIVDLGTRVVISSGNRTLEFDSAGKMNIPGYSWQSGIVSLFVNVSGHSLNAEIMTDGNLLAQEQIEIILANKAGTGSGYGYSAITTAKYASVNPTSPFNSFGRTVTVTSQNLAGSASYPSKIITVRVTHELIPPVVLTTIILDHTSL